MNCSAIFIHHRFSVAKRSPEELPEGNPKGEDNCHMFPVKQGKYESILYIL